MIINFGKYSGQTVAQITTSDYSYAVWAAREITNTEIKTEFVAEIKKPEYKNEAIKPFLAAANKYKHKMDFAFCPVAFQKAQGDNIFAALGLECEERYNTEMFGAITDLVVSAVEALNESDKITLTNFPIWGNKIANEGIAAIITRLPKSSITRLSEAVIYADEIGWATAKGRGPAMLESEHFKNWQFAFRAMSI